jgi:hypothetical protein
MKNYVVISIALFLLLAVSGCVAPRYSKPVYRPAPTPAPGPQSSRQHKIARPRVEPPVNQREVRQVPPQPVPRPANRAVANFSSQADLQIRQGKLKSAAQTLERGLRISSKDAQLWSKLAKVRLLQHRYTQAISLATKSNSLARGNQWLVQQNRQIIKNAQQGQ